MRSRLCEALKSTNSITAISRSSRKQLDKGPAHASCYIPIDRPHIVADLVRPNFLELNTATLKR